jgi:Xaa-Pro aminopeptidase
MTATKQAYEGDSALTGRLKGAGAPYDAAGVRALLAGVGAAPQGEDPDAWMRLLARSGEAPLDEALKSQLRALRTSIPTAETVALAAKGPARGRRLAALRAELQRRGLAGFVVPHADEHMGEYLPPRAERLAWLTGFTGSAGLAVVLADKAAIFVDGRYTLQVRDQADLDLFTPLHLIDEPFEDWIAANLPAGGKLGYDPWLHTAEGVKRLTKGVTRAKGELVACDGNPLDAVWSDQPPPPIAPVIALEERFTGRSAADKRAAIGGKLVERDLAAAVLTAPDSIAWLLNIRGADVPRTPLPLSFAVVRADGAVDLFIDRRKLTPGLERWLGNSVVVRRPEELGAALDALGA